VTFAIADLDDHAGTASGDDIAELLQDERRS
jgi:hypothetical protein